MFVVTFLFGLKVPTRNLLLLFQLKHEGKIILRADKQRQISK